MERNAINFIQGQIGYNFKNTDLMYQAFVRKSYSEEHGGADNEVLEFIGDKVLDIIVVKALAQEYGKLASMSDNYNSEKDLESFYSELDEGELTEKKRQLVEKKNLARRIDELDLADYLMMGKGDIQKNIKQEMSVKEDLFEAILGAVAIDSNWNFEELEETVKVMLNLEEDIKQNEEDNYVSLIQEWTLRKYGEIPLYHIEKRSCQASLFKTFNGTEQFINPMSPDFNEMKYCCIMKLSDDLHEFLAYGRSKNMARKEVCKLAYTELKDKGMLFTIRDEIENPNREESINQLETLARRGFFSIPTYDFEETYDNDGNPIWECRCSIAKKEKSFSESSSSKKEAKKSAAFKMLSYVLE